VRVGGGGDRAGEGEGHSELNGEKVGTGTGDAEGGCSCERAVCM
jgi:hypothetical protein